MRWHSQAAAARLSAQGTTAAARVDDGLSGSVSGSVSLLLLSALIRQAAGRSSRLLAAGQSSATSRRYWTDTVRADA